MAVCASRAPKTTHSGVWLIDSRYWGLRASRYGGNAHHCATEGQPRGCAMAAQLRAVNALLDALPEGVGVDLLLTNSDAVPVLNKWLAGKPEMPAWYTANANGTLHQLAARLAQMSPGFITVSAISASDTMQAAAALELAASGKTAYDRLVAGANDAETQLDHEIATILAALNA